MENIEKKATPSKGDNLEVGAEAKKVIKEIEENFDDAERGIGDVLGGIEAEAGAYREASNVLGKLRKKISNKFVALFAIGVLSAAGSGEASASNIEANPNPKNKTELSFDQKETVGGNTYIMAETKSNQDIKEIESEEKNKLTFKTNFNMASIEVSKEAREKLENEVENFISGFSREDLKKIKKHKMIVNIEAGSSDEKVIGKQTTELGTYSNNYELSVLRSEIMRKMVEKELSEKDINPFIHITIPVIDGKEPGVSSNNERFAEVNIVEMTNENIVKYFDTIIMDKSGSMLNDANKIEEILKENAEKKYTKLLTKETDEGTKEYHYASIKKAIEEANPYESIIVITDEKEDATRITKERIDDLKKLADDKNISVTVKMLNPDNEKGGMVIFDYFRISFNELTNAEIMSKGTLDQNVFDNLKKLNQ